MQYRPELDGLRAVSVLAVVLFHLGVPGFDGGFVGVDVFFVISGYLITSIVHAEAVSGRFSLSAFYDRRIRRILPALLSMLVATLLAGYWMLTPDDYAATASSAAYAAASVGNVYFYRNTGYFDGASALMPLLHTWSLGVEEQFYVVWPVFVLALVSMFKRRRQGLLVVVSACVVASFAFGAVQLASNPKAAFYLPLGRAWQLMLGATLTLRPSKAIPTWTRQVGSALGLASIGLAVVTFDASASYPGGRALLPTLGAALVIDLATATTVVGSLLGSAPAVFVGKISYSLYLWHWPLLVFTRHYGNGAALLPREAATLFVLSILVSWASYHWIEQPFRHARPAPATSIRLGLIFSGVTAALAVIIAASGGVPGRMAPEVQALRDRDVMWDWNCPYRVNTSMGDGLCAVGAPWETARRHGLVWGDSHAEHFAPLLDVVGRSEDIAFVLWRSCPPFIREGGVERLLEEAPTYNSACGKERAAALTYLADSDEIDFVVLAANWTYYPEQLYRGDRSNRSTARGLTLMREGLDELLPAISRPSRQILLFGDVPHVGYEPIPCVLSRAGSLLRRRCTTDPSRIPAADYFARQAETIGLLRETASRWNSTAMIPGDRMCSEDGCSTIVNGEFLYRDEHHLRRNLMPVTLEALVDRLELRAVFQPSSDVSVGTESTGDAGPRRRSP